MYHGHTFTSKIPFREVVSTLGKYAFKVKHPSPGAGGCGWSLVGEATWQWWVPGGGVVLRFLVM